MFLQGTYNLDFVLHNIDKYGYEEMKKDFYYQWLYSHHYFYFIEIIIVCVFIVYGENP